MDRKAWKYWQKYSIVEDAKISDRHFAKADNKGIFYSTGEVERAVSNIIEDWEQTLYEAYQDKEDNRQMIAEAKNAIFDALYEFRNIEELAVKYASPLSNTISISPARNITYYTLCNLCRELVISDKFINDIKFKHKENCKWLELINDLQKADDHIKNNDHVLDKIRYMAGVRADDRALEYGTVPERAWTGSEPDEQPSPYSIGNVGKLKIIQHGKEVEIPE